MKKWKMYTPDGVQDILFNQCYRKRMMENTIRDVFSKSGYFEVETPTIEFYDVFSAGNELISQENMFKFSDEKGRMLVLRPDITIPVARIAATRLKEVNWPVRCSYIGNTFSYNEMGGGRQKEYTQAGVELLGISSPEADAEIIAVAIKAIKALGIDEFQIDIGQVEFFKGIMEETGLSDEEVEELRLLIDSKDFVGVEQLVKSHEISNDLRELILNLPKLFGSLEVIDRIEKLNINKRAYGALENLKSIISILEDWGLGQYVSIDLGMVQSLTYYTGIIFRGFTYGVGFPILSGGRYDNLVGLFGKYCPATGFSLGINMIMVALERNRKDTAKPGIDVMVVYSPGGRNTAYEIAEEHRQKGESTILDIAGRTIDEAKAYAVGKGIRKLVYVMDSGNSEEIVVSS